MTELEDTKPGWQVSENDSHASLRARWRRERDAEAAAVAKPYDSASIERWFTSVPDTAPSTTGTGGAEVGRGSIVDRRGLNDHRYEALEVRQARSEAILRRLDRAEHGATHVAKKVRERLDALEGRLEALDDTNEELNPRLNSMYDWFKEYGTCVSDRLNNMERRLNVHIERIETLHGRLDEVDTHFDQHDDRFAEQGEKHAKHAEKLDAYLDRIEWLEKETVRLEANAAGLDENVSRRLLMQLRRIEALEQSPTPDPVLPVNMNPARFDYVETTLDGSESDSETLTDVIIDEQRQACLWVDGAVPGSVEFPGDGVAEPGLWVTCSVTKDGKAFTHLLLGVAEDSVEFLARTVNEAKNRRRFWGSYPSFGSDR